MKNSVVRILMGLIITVSFMSQVNAAEVGYLEDKEGKVDINIQSASESLDYIWYTSSEINDIGDQYLRIQAETECLQNVDYITMNVELQKKVNGVWVEAREWTVNDTNTDYFDFDVVYTNALVGTSYRVKTVHTVVENGDSESTYTWTSGIIVQ